MEWETCAVAGGGVTKPERWNKPIVIELLESVANDTDDLLIWVHFPWSNGVEALTIVRFLASPRVALGEIAAENQVAALEACLTNCRLHLGNGGETVGDRTELALPNVGGCRYGTAHVV